MPWAQQRFTLRRPPYLTFEQLLRGWTILWSCSIAVFFDIFRLKIKYFTIYTKNCTFWLQYLGSFPVRAVDQSTRANLVRKQLSIMKVNSILILIFKMASKIYFFLLKDVPAKRPVLVNISLEGIKVCCPQGQVRRPLVDSFFCSLVHFGLQLGLWPTLEKAFVVVL